MGMKIFRGGILSAAFVFISLEGSIVAHAKEQKLAREKVPVEVLSAFQKAYPQAVARGYEEEVKHGKTFYEIESKDGETNRDILFSPAGEIVEIEEMIQKTEIPQIIQQASAAKFPQAEIRRAEKIARNGNTYYEIEFKQGEKHFSKEFDAQGAFVKE